MVSIGILIISIPPVLSRFSRSVAKNLFINFSKRFFNFSEKLYNFWAI